MSAEAQIKAPAMSQNDFYVAIQGVMTAAHDAGWDLDQLHDYATDAADEWLGEMETDEVDGRAAPKGGA